MQAKRNGMIDFMRFVFSIVIVLQHASLFRGVMLAGYIGVEFFFIVSGWLLMERIQKNNSQINFLNETYRKIRGFYTEFFIATITAVVLLNYFGISQQWPAHLLGTFNDLLLLQMFGFFCSSNTGVLWYLTVMVASYHLLFYLVYTYNQKFIQVFIPVIILVIYGGMSYKFHTLSALLSPTLDGFLLCGMLRGFAGMSFGIILHEGSEKISGINFSDLGIKILGIIELSCYIFAIYIAVLIKVFSDYDFLMLAFIGIAIMITFSKVTFSYKYFNSNIYNKLGKLSLNIFLNHYFIAVIIANKFSECATSEKMQYYFIGIGICTIFNYYAGFVLRRKFNWFKNLLVIDNR